MKVRIEKDESIKEDEIIIRCKEINDNIRNLQQYINDASGKVLSIAYYKDNQEFFFPVEMILFFETDDDMVYAHTADEAYKVKFRLYELEKSLSKDFVRISKSAVINVRYINSIDRNLTSASLITFFKSYKQVYVSRFYYKGLKQRLDERRSL